MKRQATYHFFYDGHIVIFIYGNNDFKDNDNFTVLWYRDFFEALWDCPINSGDYIIWR